MKKLWFFVVLAIIGGSLMAAAPDFNEWAVYLGDEVTIDSQWEASPWQLLDSIIVIKTDTCFTLYTMSGYVDLGSTDKLYLGFDDGGGKNGLPTDTFIIQAGGIRYGKQSIPFMVRYLDSLWQQGDLNDTIYFYAAKGNSATPMVIRNLLLHVQVIDFNAAGVIGE